MNTMYLLVLFTSQIIQAAPYPLTGSSLFLDNKKNLFLTPYGFSLNLEKSQAQILLNQNDLEKWILQFPNTEQLFTMRIRQFKSELEYEKSLRIWIREYQKSGLKIIDKNIRSKKPTKGWIHLEDPSGKQILQYFTFVNPTWVYFGCVGIKSEAQQLHQNCEHLNSQVQKLTE
jgi:hypothetical protein